MNCPRPTPLNSRADAMRCTEVAHCYRSACHQMPFKACAIKWVNGPLTLGLEKLSQTNCKVGHADKIGAGQ